MGLSKLFALGFAESQILGCEHLLSGEKDLAPNSVLIDDLPPTDQIAMVKKVVLGIRDDRYFQVPPFTASIFEPEPLLTLRLGDFLQRLVSDKGRGVVIR